MVPNPQLITLFAMATITFLFGMLPLALFAQLRNNTDPSSKIRRVTGTHLTSLAHSIRLDQIDFLNRIGPA